jgi:tryptophan synthase alpha chain
MSRLTNAFANSAKVAYLTAGDGGEKSLDYFLALTKGGANVLEIGVPFSDPVADGPSIQLAMERSLNNGTNLQYVINLIHKLRDKTDAAIIVFTYYNPICHDLENFLIKIKQAGADGILVVDLPFEENEDLRFLCNKHSLSPIMVASPSTSLERVAMLSKHSSGFLYYACRKGTTGIRSELPVDITEQIKQVKEHSVLPVAVGFGVSNSVMVNQLLSIADGCVIGSYFVNAIANGKTPNELEVMAKEVFAC